MSKFTETFKQGFKNGQESAKSETIRNKDSSNPKVIVFEENGDINVATLINTDNFICRENLTNFEPCPKRIIDTVPPEIVELCKLSLPHYLYLTADENGKVHWESTCDIKC